MKRHLCLAACWLLAQPAAQAQAPGADAPGKPVCPGFRDAGGSHMTMDQMRDPVERAIVALDNVDIEPPSPVLATGKLTWLGVSTPMAEDLADIRILGWFHVRAAQCVIPFAVNRVEAVRGDPERRGNERTRIYYRMPNLDGVAGRFALYQPMILRIAAFGKDANGEFNRAVFGNKLELTVSGKYTSAGLALSFCALFYLLAAAAVASAVRRELPGAARGWRTLGERLMPWNILSDSSQTALSQLQMLLFTLIIATLLFYQWLRTGLLQELSTDLLYLVGISTAGAAGSLITSSFKRGLDAAAYRYVQQLGWFTAPLARLQARTDPAELLMTNKRFDANKFQMLVFTFVIAAYVVEAGASELDNLHISTTLLTLMGISQGAYVGGHAASDGMAALQHQLRGMQSLQARHRAGTDEDARMELRRRFALAAARAAAMFGALHGRDVPADMLEMPPDAPADDDAETDADAAVAAVP